MSTLPSPAHRRLQTRPGVCRPAQVSAVAVGALIGWYRCTCRACCSGHTVRELGWPDFSQKHVEPTTGVQSFTDTLSLARSATSAQGDFTLTWPRRPWLQGKCSSATSRFVRPSWAHVILHCCFGAGMSFICSQPKPLLGQKLHLLRCTCAFHRVDSRQPSIRLTVLVLEAQIDPFGRGSFKSRACRKAARGRCGKQYVTTASGQ
jgi:hypothetical protein